jgi:MFS transporter, DHA1 family, inner membrane transport protein
MPRLLYLLAFCNLVIGTGAFVPAGILAQIADALQISIGAAGQMMTVYALSTAVFAPLALIATGRWPRRRALWVGMALFTLGNVVCALSNSLPLLLAGRLLMGVGAMFTPIAAGIAVALVPPEKRGRALSLVFIGMSMSYVIGLPLGAWLGGRFGWHVPVAGVAAVSLLMTALLATWLPRDIRAPGASFQGLAPLLAQPAVLWTLGMTLLYFTAIFLVFAYIGPVLQALVPMGAEQLSLTLMVFGVAGVAGTLLGGWANDRYAPRPTLTLQLATLALMMFLVPFTRGNYPLLLLAFVVWGMAGFGMMTPQQSRLASLAPAQTPILLSLNTSMLYVGTALGAAIGGATSAVVGFDRLGWVGVPFALAGLATLAISHDKARHLKPG